MVRKLPTTLFVLTILFSLAFSFLAPATPIHAQSGVENQEQPVNWTFMVYMSGDSSLSNNVPEDLNEMKIVGSGDSLNMIVLVDRSGSLDTQLLRIMKEDTESIPLSHVNSSWGNELNLGRAQTLIDFIVWTAGNYPADRYVLDLWGHGKGWQGVCPDNDDLLEPAEIRTAMVAVSEAGISLDVVSVDACQMGMLEVIYELRHAARFAVASEKDVPLSGWPYDKVLAIIDENPQITVEEFGAEMVDAYLDWGVVYSRYSLTLAFIDLSGIEGLAQAVDSYSAEAVKTVGYFNEEMTLARAETEKYDGDFEYDLRHLIENINARTEYKKLEVISRDIFSSLESCIAYERHWTNDDDEPADNAHGLSIWFPRYSSTLVSSYAHTGFGQDTGWDEFLSALIPYFSDPSRTDAPMTASAISTDSDSDGLADRFDFAVDISQTGTQFELELYGPAGSLIYENGADTTGQHSFSHSPAALGKYSAAFYLWEDDRLVNYSLVDTNLNKEGRSQISGRVLSNIGRGLRWTRIDLYEESGRLIGSTTTSFDGQYLLSIKVPTETDGVNLTLSCGLGNNRQNITLQQLFGENSHDFELETSDVSVLWLSYATMAANVVSIVFLAVWLIRRRDSAGKKPD